MGRGRQRKDDDLVRLAEVRGIAAGRDGNIRSPQTALAPSIHARCDAPRVAGARNRPVQSGIGAHFGVGTSRSPRSGISVEIRAQRRRSWTARSPGDHRCGTFARLRRSQLRADLRQRQLRVALCQSKPKRAPALVRHADLWEQGEGAALLSPSSRGDSVNARAASRE